MPRRRTQNLNNYVPRNTQFGGMSRAQLYNVVKYGTPVVKKAAKSLYNYLYKSSAKGKKKSSNKFGPSRKKMFPGARSKSRGARHASLSHRAMAKNYSFNSLDYCVTEELAMYNAPRALVIAIPELDDYHSYHDTHVIENNGVIPSSGLPPAISTFQDSDVSLYCKIDFTQAVGKYASSAAPVESANITNQIYSLRKHFKKWKKQHIKFTIKWDSQIDNLHQLNIPEGYYMVVPRMKVKTMLDAQGEILIDSAKDTDIFRVETQELSAIRVLGRRYGIPTPYVNTATKAGNFPNTAEALVLNPMPQEIFTFENVERNPTGWKKIPRTNTLQIDVNYDDAVFANANTNNVFTDPVIYFIFKEVPDSWKQQVQATTGLVNPTSGSTALNTTPAFSNRISVAKIADISVLHCYRYKDRCEDLVGIDSAGYPNVSADFPY